MTIGVLPSYPKVAQQGKINRVRQALVAPAIERAGLRRSADPPPCAQGITGQFRWVGVGAEPINSHDLGPFEEVEPVLRLENPALRCGPSLLRKGVGRHDRRDAIRNIVWHGPGRRYRNDPDGRHVRGERTRRARYCGGTTEQGAEQGKGRKDMGFHSAPPRRATPRRSGVALPHRSGRECRFARLRYQSQPRCATRRRCRGQYCATRRTCTAVVAVARARSNVTPPRR